MKNSFSHELKNAVDEMLTGLLPSWPKAILLTWTSVLTCLSLFYHFLNPILRGIRKQL
jgi:hypothetical protein